MKKEDERKLLGGQFFAVNLSVVMMVPRMDKKKVGNFPLNSSADVGENLGQHRHGHGLGLAGCMSNPAVQ